MASRIQKELSLLVTGRDVSASRALRGVNKEVRNLQKAAGKAGTNISRNIERGIVLGAGAAAGALGYAVKAAIDFEDAFAGVRKTVEGSPAELAALNKELRALATRVPVDFTDLAGIAAEAGALGVPTTEVADFTEVIARLSAATVGLTTEAAAEAFGKLGNVLNLHGPDFERMGSALVALGNAGASSEGDIIEVAKRFGAAGAQAHLSAAEVLGFSSAIASMGVEPEAAGSSLSRLFNNITKYIGTGNAKIKTFAKVSGVSVKTFSDLFAKDASGAVQLFLTNLSKLDNFQAAKVLKDAGIINVRDINAVLLLARGHGELARQLDLSTEAYRANTELQSVSEKRFATTANQVKILENNVKDAAATIGSELLPVVNELAKEGIDWLHGHQAEIAAFAKDLAAGIRDAVKWAKSLDWNAIGNALKAGAGFAKGLVEAFASAPPWLQEFLAVGFVANKFTGGAVQDVIGTLASGLIKGVLGMNAGVVNIKAGVVNGAGGGLAAGKAGSGKLGNLAGIATKVFIAGAAIGVFAELKGILDEQSGRNKGQEADLATQTRTFSGGASLADLKTALAGVDAQIADLNRSDNFSLQGLAFGANIDGVRDAVFATRADLVAAIKAQGGDTGVAGRISDALTLGLATVLNRPLPDGSSARDMDGAGFRRVADASTDAAEKIRSAVYDSGDETAAKTTHSISALATQLGRDIHGLRTATKPVDIAKFARSIQAEVAKGAGSFEGTKGIVADLRKKLGETHDPKTAAILRAAIHAVEAKLPERQWVDRQLAKADKIVASTDSTKQKIIDLNAIQRTLRDRGDTHAAALITARINVLKGSVDSLPPKIGAYLAPTRNTGGGGMGADRPSSPSSPSPAPTPTPAPRNGGDNDSPALHQTVTALGGIAQTGFDILGATNALAITTSTGLAGVSAQVAAARSTTAIASASVANAARTAGQVAAAAIRAKDLSVMTAVTIPVTNRMVVTNGAITKAQTTFSKISGFSTGKQVPTA